MALLFPAGAQFLDSNGLVLAAGTLTFYATTTTTSKAVYSDVGLSVSVANPYTLDSSGRIAVNLYGDGDYTILAKDSTGATIWSRDDVFGWNDGTPYYERTAAEIAAGVTPTAYQYEPGDVRRYGAVGDGVTDDSAAIQSAIDVAYGDGGGVVLFHGLSYSIADTLHIGSKVVLDLQMGEIICTANNVPIVIADKAAANAYWQVRNGTLRYSTQQTSSDTDGIGIRVATTNTNSYEYVCENLIISKAYSAIDLPELTGCTAFFGMHRNIRADSCAVWGFDFLGAASGARTNLAFEDCYAVQNVGSEIAGSALGRFKRTQELRIVSLAGDHLQGVAGSKLVQIESCTGTVGVIAIESCDLSLSTATGSYIEVTGSRLEIEYLKCVDNNVTISGDADFCLLRAITSSKVSVTSIDDRNTTLTDTSSGGYYTIIPDATSKVRNVWFTAVGTSPAGSIGEFGTNAELSVESFNGNVRSWKQGGKLELHGTAIPSSGTYAVGDRLVNTAQSATSPVTGWVCTVAGTSGTWRPYASLTGQGVTGSRPTLTASDIGVAYLDTTLDADGKPIWWNGTAWVDATGATA